MEEPSLPIKITATIIAILTFLLLGISVAIVNGFVLMMLWQWFLVPLYLPKISLFHAIGISMIVRFLTWQYIDDNPHYIVENEEGEEMRPERPNLLVKIVVLGLIWPGMVLLAGFLARQFM